nr:hypothetical protein BaRGS_006944 [Batillaria attramentaria]
MMPDKCSPVRENRTVCRNDPTMAMWNETDGPDSTSSPATDFVVGSSTSSSELLLTSTASYLDLRSTSTGGVSWNVTTTDGAESLCNRSLVECVTGFNVTVNGSWIEDELNGTGEGVPALPHSAIEVVLICIVVVVLSIFTAGGNLLVIVAFRIDKQLQTVSNYFLLSLAVADLTIGVISMPLYTLYLLMGHWPLGALLCDIWLALDYTMSNASVANLIIISFDRYLSVTRPLTYRAKRTPRRAGIMICTAWLVSVLLWTPWIFAWPYIEGKRNVPETECYIQFLKTNRYMSIFTAMAAFYVPVSIMFVIYHRIYRETRKRQKDLPKLQGMKPEGKGGSKKSTTFSSDDDDPAGSSVRDKRNHSSPELEDLEAFQAHMHRNMSFKSRLLACLRIDRDSDYIEESSTSDPSASPASSNALTHAVVSPTIYRPNGPTSSASSSQKSTYKNSHASSVSYVVRPQINCSSSLIPLLPVESPQQSPAPSPVSPPSELTTSFSRHSRISAVTPLLEADRENGREDEEEESEEEEEEADGGDHVVRNNNKDRMYTVVIRLPGDTSCDDSDDVTKDDHVRSRPSIRMTPDSDADSFADINPELVQKDPDSDDSLPMIRPSHQRRPPPLDERAASREDAEHSDEGSNDSDHTRVQPPVRPPTGTPALARRAQSNDTHKVAQQAKIAAKVAVRVRQRQRARSKVAWRRQERRQDQKAAKTLTAILLAFLITWTPYNIFTLVEAFCTGCINDTLYAIGEPG